MDIKQGSLGDCYFLRALSALAEIPCYIESLFGNKEYQENWLYGIYLCVNGINEEVIVDDIIPKEIQLLKKSFYLEIMLYMLNLIGGKIMIAFGNIFIWLKIGLFSELNFPKNEEKKSIAKIFDGFLRVHEKDTDEENVYSIEQGIKRISGTIAGYKYFWYQNQTTKRTLQETLRLTGVKIQEFAHLSKTNPQLRLFGNRWKLLC